MVDTKYILNLKINKELSYTKGLFSQRENDKVKFSFYEIQAEKMLKVNDSNLGFPLYQDKSETVDPLSNTKIINYKELNEGFSTIFSYLQFYEKKENLVDMSNETSSD